MLIYHQFLPCARHQLKLLLQWRSGRFFVWTWRGLSLRKFVFQMFFFQKAERITFFSKPCREISDFQTFSRALVTDRGTGTKEPSTGGAWHHNHESTGAPSYSEIGVYIFSFRTRTSPFSEGQDGTTCRGPGFLSTKACGKFGWFVWQLWCFFDVFWFLIFFWWNSWTFRFPTKTFWWFEKVLFFAWKFKTISFNNMFVIFWWDFFFGERNKINATVGVSSNYLFAFNPRLRRWRYRKIPHDWIRPHLKQPQWRQRLKSRGECVFFFVKPGRCVFLNEKNQLLLTVNCWFGLVGGLRF